MTDRRFPYLLTSDDTLAVGTAVECSYANTWRVGIDAEMAAHNRSNIQKLVPIAYRRLF